MRRISLCTLIIALLAMLACSENKIGPTQPDETKFTEEDNSLLKQQELETAGEENSPSIIRLNKNGKTETKLDFLAKGSVREEYQVDGHNWVAAAWIWDITEPYQNPTLQFGAYSASYDLNWIPDPIDYIYVNDDVKWRPLGYYKWLHLVYGEEYWYNWWLAYVEWIASCTDAWEANSYSDHYFQDGISALYVEDLYHPPVAARWIIDKVSE